MNIKTPRKATHRCTALQSEAESAAERTQSSATDIDINEYASVPDPAIARVRKELVYKHIIQH